MCKRLHSDIRHLMKPDSIVPFHRTDWDYLPHPLAELSQCILDSSNGSIINVI